MANTAQMLTGQSTPDGRIPFLQYVPVDTSVPQPLIIFLHGQDHGSNIHDLSSVTILDSQQSGGVLWHTNASNPATNGILPSFSGPDGIPREFYVLGPQLYYATAGSTTTTWTNNYIDAMVTYAKANLNIDRSRIYLTGLSLGGGGTITAMCFPSTARQFAATAAAAPGYGQFYANSQYVNFANTGVPHWHIHCADDTTAPISVSDIFVDKVRSNKPLVDIKYNRIISGNHGGSWTTLYALNNLQKQQTLGSGAGQANAGNDMIMIPNMYQWFLKYSRRVHTDPFIKP